MVGGWGNENVPWVRASPLNQYVDGFKGAFFVG